MTTMLLFKWWVGFMLAILISAWLVILYYEEFNRNRRRFLFFIFCLVLCYNVVASVIFAFRHPKATETQRFEHTWDALLLREVPELK